MDLLTAMASGGLSIVNDQINNAVQYYNQKHLNKQAQSDTQENMKLAQKLNLDSSFQSVKQYTAALKAAGLNPALAVGGQPSVTGVSAPAGSAGQAVTHASPIASALSAANELALQESQKRNIDANTDKTKAESEKLWQDVEHTSAWDDVINEQTRILITEMAENTDNSMVQYMCDNFLSNFDKLNIGHVNGFIQTFFELPRLERERELDYISKEFDKLVLQKQYDSGAADALADMPRAQRLLILKNIAQIDALVAHLNADTSLTEDRRKEIRAKIENLGQQTSSLLHHDPAAMYHEGEIAELGVMLGFEALKAVSTGAGFAVGAKMVGKGVSSSASLPSGKVPYSRMSRTEVQHRLELFKGKIRALKTAKESAARNARLGELYRENKELLERLKSFGSSDYAR